MIIDYFKSYEQSWAKCHVCNQPILVRKYVRNPVFRNQEEQEEVTGYDYTKHYIRDMQEKWLMMRATYTEVGRACHIVVSADDKGAVNPSGHNDVEYLEVIVDSIG